MSAEYDLIVLGGGPAGYPAAIRASQLKARVCLIEREALGGVCLNRGCIPTKTMHGLAHLLEIAGGGAEAGIKGTVEADMRSLQAHKNRTVNSLVSGVEKLLRESKVDVVRGEGRIVRPGEVEVEGQGSIRGGNIILATGSVEVELPGMEFNGATILGGSDLLNLERIPESMLVVGGGVIGCEFASIFNAFGTRVSIVEMLPSLIATEDDQVIRFLQTYFRKKGIQLYLGTRVEGMASSAGGVTVRLEEGREIAAEVVLVSVGRRPNISGAGLPECGITIEKNRVVTNRRMETNLEGVYAAGDVIGGWLLAHVATREGLIAARNALGGEEEIDYQAVPTTIYTLPEVSRVGLTEREARERGLDVAVGRFPFAANGKAKGLREEEGFVKWVAAKKDGGLLGLHIIGPQATELLTAGILAVKRGMTISDFTSAILPHPTLSEALGEAAEHALGRAIHLLR
ncbi:MAG: dihydrolipoyl dehydrogenase [Candidatus Krumholzibacteriota bacterium]|nr:dihydrolipoyl dehydrogenase [Candidatus Krumholzibacteriota bacterium]